MSVTCVLGVCLFFEKVYPMVLGWVDEVGDKSWWGQVSCSHYLNEECKEGHGRWCFSFPFSGYCWRGASSDADILKLGCFRNGRCGREAWKETESSSGSFLSVMVLEDLICPFVFQEYHLGAVQIIWSFQLSAFLLSPRGTLGLLPLCVSLQG